MIFNRLSQKKTDCHIKCSFCHDGYICHKQALPASFLFQYYDSQLLKDLFYVFPNFWGTFILYLMSKYFLGHPFWKSLLYVLALNIIYESLHIVNFGTSFDIYDILASVVALILIAIYELLIKPNIHRKNILFKSVLCKQRKRKIVKKKNI